MMVSVSRWSVVGPPESFLRSEKLGVDGLWSKAARGVWGLSSPSRARRVRN